MAVEGLQKLIALLGDKVVDTLVVAAAFSLIGMLFLLARIGLKQFAAFAAKTPNKIDDELARDAQAGLDAVQGNVQDAIRPKK